MEDRGLYEVQERVVPILARSAHRREAQVDPDCIYVEVRLGEMSRNPDATAELEKRPVGSGRRVRAEF